MRFFAYSSLSFVSDALMRLYAFCCIIFLRDFLNRYHVFLPIWVVRWRGMIVNWVVIGWWSVLGGSLEDRRVCVEFVWFVSPACIKSSQLNMLLWFKEIHSGVCVGGVMYVIWRMFAYFGLSQYVDQGFSAFFSCTLTVNVIGLLFLWQCFFRLPLSTETSSSGTSRMWPLCIKVSRYVYWRMAWRDVNSCYCDFIRFPDEFSCFWP